MTIDQLNKLTDEEVRVRVAGIMGYSDIHFDAGYGAICGRIHHPDDWSEYLPVPHYQADLNTAFTLVEKLKEELCFNLTFEQGIYIAEFYAIDSRKAQDRNPARAICLAFLAVTEREEG